MNEAFEKWWKEEGKEMKFYAGEYQEHRGIAKQAYLAATERAAGIAGYVRKHFPAELDVDSEWHDAWNAACDNIAQNIRGGEVS